MVLAIILAVVTFSSGVFSFCKFWAAGTSQHGFYDMLPWRATVIRNGRKEGVDADDLVRGDLIEVRFGEKIPADCIIVSAQDMKVDHGALTGEFEPLPRSQYCTHDMFFESKNVIFFGTFCVQGTCQAIVVRTGDATVVGQIVHSIDNNEYHERTLMELEIYGWNGWGGLTSFISLIAVLLGSVVFIMVYFFGLPIYSFGEDDHLFTNSLICMLGIILALIPQGLEPALEVSRQPGQET
jgi:sodium/potassium-transporting ATPase subunit alpha